MSEAQVIYYDMINIPADIRAIVNINKYGDLHYKKMTLFDYTQSIFRSNSITHFSRVNSKEDLHILSEQLKYTSSEDFIFISSNITITNKEAFSIFLKKINYLDTSLALFKDRKIKPLLRLKKSEIIELINLIRSEEWDLQEILEKKFSHLEAFGQESFFLEIKSYVDFVSYLQSNFELRYFNSIKSSKNILTKTSAQKEKMLKEFSYYNVIPDEMKLFFLRPFAYKEHQEYAEYSLERLNILDLSIQWIHFSIDNHQFTNLLERLFTFIEIRKNKNTSKEEIKKNIENLYIRKVEDRINDLKKTTVFPAINNIIKASTPYASMEEIVVHYKNIFEEIIDYKNYLAVVSMSHGDLCFSNILYDKRIDFLKLIDPKGCTTEEEAYLDMHYDVAKLSHSILGNYDFINNGLFEIIYDNDLKASLQIHYKEDLSSKKILFKEYLNKHDYSYTLVRLYEASLFISMLPLHIDYPKKLVAFILTAAEILSELEKNIKKTDKIKSLV